MATFNWGNALYGTAYGWYRIFDEFPSNSTPIMAKEITVEEVIETTSKHTDMLRLNTILAELKVFPRVLSMVMQPIEDNTVVLAVYSELRPVGRGNLGPNSKIVFMNV